MPQQKKRRRLAQVLSQVAGMALILAGCSLSPAAGPTYQVVVDKLDEPRGLWLRADGTLCVAEAGRLAEDQKADSQAATILANTGALTCVDKSGRRERVVENLPHVVYGESGVSVGPADVAELDGSLYLLTGEGYGDLSRKLLRLDTSGRPTVVADFLKFAAQGKPLEYIQPASIAANPYAMLPDPPHRRFLVTDGASGQVMAAGVDGKITVYAPQDGHDVLTGIAWGLDGWPYVASFSELPHPAGQGAIYRLQPDGGDSVALGNLTTPIDLAFDPAGRLYVLEFIYASAADNPYLGKTGRLLRFEGQGDGWAAGQILVEGIPYPTAMLFGPNGSLYVSVHGAFSPPGSGAVVRFDGLVSQKSGQAPLEYHPWP